jgi:hypothetical protein
VVRSQREERNELGDWGLGVIAGCVRDRKDNKYASITVSRAVSPGRNDSALSLHKLTCHISVSPRILCQETRVGEGLTVVIIRTSKLDGIFFLINFN